MSESVEEFEQKQLQEKLAKMSPEELAKWQKDNCVFCKIVSGEQRSLKVYDDSVCIVLLDIYPATKGHVLIIPKDHFMVMPQVPDSVIRHMGMVSKAFSHAILRANNVEGSSVFIANGGVAGQRAQHFMIHIIPREEHDGFPSIPQHQINSAEASKIREALQKTIKRIMGINEEQTEHKEEHNESKKHNESPKHENAPAKTEPAKKVKQKKPKTEKQTKSKNEDSGSVSLDDIAGLFS